MANADDGQLSFALPKNTILHSDKGDYKIVKTLGHGGFGIVYGALDDKRNRVAIKEYFPSSGAMRSQDLHTVLPNTSSQNGVKTFNSQMKRFLAEAKHMESFDTDPNLVRVLDSFQENQTAYIVMEFIAGNTLQETLRRLEKSNQKMDWDAMIKYFSPLVDVLERIHKTTDSSGSFLIHRDISPDNIIFDSKSKTVKLLDFGAARVVSPNGSFTLTEIGKRHYSPPEQFVASGEAARQGAWTDVYALAATIYRSITGELLPHVQEREHAVIHSGKDILKPPSAFGVNISKAQEKALLKGLELDYRKRYQSVREFFNDLSAAPTKTVPTLSLGPWQKSGSVHQANIVYNGDGKVVSSIGTINGNILKVVSESGNFSGVVTAQEGAHFAKATVDFRVEAENNPSPSNPPSNQKALLAAGLSIILAICGFAYMKTADDRCQKIKQEISSVQKQVSDHEYIEQYYGHGSSEYYAEIPILVLEKNGGTGNIPVYWSGWEDSNSKFDVETHQPNEISVKWSDEVKNHRCELTVTAGSKEGAYPIHFSNKKDSDSFDVLVVVK